MPKINATVNAVVRITDTSLLEIGLITSPVLPVFHVIGLEPQ
jgi:hypothetical protein